MSGAGEDLEALARSIIDSNLYMVLGTADQAGQPWVTPVYFAPAGYREFIWVSVPDAKHSRNLDQRSGVGIVIFDSTVAISTGRGVYMSATAEEVGAQSRAEALDVFSARALSHGGREFTPEDVEAPARRRLYRATAVEQYVLDEYDERVPVTL